MSPLTLSDGRKIPGKRRVQPRVWRQRAEAVVRQFIYVPLSRLILTGELKTHRRWLAVYGEDGIAIVPDET